MSDFIHRVSSYEAEIGQAKKIVLLYSGGLDTSCILKWIQERFQAQVVTLTLDLGQQFDDLEKIRQNALKLGASAAYVLDAQNDFAERYLTKAIKANGSYQGDYYISTISRYLMAEKALEIARIEGADAIAHGCTGKGNDQVRIEATAIALDPGMKIVAPLRDWQAGREEELEYARQRGVDVPQTADFQYSSDDNMWGITWESGEIEDLSQIPKIERFLTVSLLEDAPQAPEYLKLTFTDGIPCAINGEQLRLAALIRKLNGVASRHGVGVSYQLEDRVVGIKIRSVYEHPAAHVIITAHRQLETLVSTRLENQFKPLIDQKWGQLCYEGFWLDPLMDDLNAYCDKVNERVQGTVTVKLHKGKVEAVAFDSPYAVYDRKLATFMRDDSFNQKCAPGFVELVSLQMKLARRIRLKADRRNDDSACP